LVPVYHHATASPAPGWPGFGPRLLCLPALPADLHATLELEGESIDVVLFSPALDATLRPVQRKALAHGLKLAV